MFDFLKNICFNMNVNFFLSKRSGRKLSVDGYVYNKNNNQLF